MNVSSGHYVDEAGSPVAPPTIHPPLPGLVRDNSEARRPPFYQPDRIWTAACDRCGRSESNHHAWIIVISRILRVSASLGVPLLFNFIQAGSYEHGCDFSLRLIAGLNQVQDDEFVEGIRSVVRQARDAWGRVVAAIPWGRSA